MKESTVYIADILKEVGSDGPGLRNSIYFSGCPFRCPGCHNEKYWELESGHKMKIGDIIEDLMGVPYNISILGGEPFYQADALYEMLTSIKHRDPDRNVWVFTGYTYEQLIEQGYLSWLEKIDVLVDGPFVLSQRDTSRFCGSKNQRILYLHKGKIVKEE